MENIYEFTNSHYEDIINNNDYKKVIEIFLEYLEMFDQRLAILKMTKDFFKNYNKDTVECMEDLLISALNQHNREIDIQNSNTKKFLKAPFYKKLFYLWAIFDKETKHVLKTMLLLIIGGFLPLLLNNFGVILQLIIFYYSFSTFYVYKIIPKKVCILYVVIVTIFYILLGILSGGHYGH